MSMPLRVLGPLNGASWSSAAPFVKHSISWKTKGASLRLLQRRKAARIINLHQYRWVSSLGNEAELQGAIQGNGSYKVPSQLHPLRATIKEARATIDDVLQRIHAAMGGGDYFSKEHVTLTGRALIDGIQCNWTVNWCMDGRFFERFTCDKFTYEWGHDGKHVWHTDVAGRVTRLELDDGEICLLSAWIRSGFWVTMDGQKYLNIRVETQELSPVNSQLVLTVSLKHKKVVAHVIIDKRSWLPVEMAYPEFCFKDRWKFSKWKNLLPNCNCRLPTSLLQTSISVGQRSFTITKVEVDHMENFMKNGAFPCSLLVPRHNHQCPRAHMDNSYPSVVQMVKSRQGHYLVRPLVDGKDIGYFIIDTGISGLAITRTKARELNMTSFGKLYLTGISGRNVMRTAYSRGTSFELGPFKLENPMFLEVGVDKVLKDVAGLCGFDIFYGPIVEMSHVDGTFSLFDRLVYEGLPHAKNLKWQRVVFFDKVPHIEAKMNDQTVLLMLDTGCAGADLMFPNSSVEGFEDPGNGISTRLHGRREYVSQEDYGNVANFEVAGHSFIDVIGIVSRKSGQQLGFSGYCGGIMGGEMVKNFTYVFDYANRRMAFLDRRKL